MLVPVPGQLTSCRIFSTSIVQNIIAMLRTGAPRAAFRSLNSFAAAAAAASGRTTFTRNAPHFSSKLCILSSSRPVAVAKPTTMALARFASNRNSPMDTIDRKHEMAVSKENLPASPDTVSADSSTHPVFGEVGMREDQEKDTDMMAGIKQDMVSIPSAPSGIGADATALRSLASYWTTENHQGHFLP